MSLKHITLLLKVVRYLNIKQDNNKLIIKFKKEFIPILFYFQKKNFIHKYIIIKKKYIFIFFKKFNNKNLLKRIKIFDYKKNDVKKIKHLFFLKKKKTFYFYIFLTKKGFLTNLNNCLIKNTGGHLIVYVV